MKTFKLLTLFALCIGFTSCSTDNDDDQILLEVEAETVTNLYAPQQGGQGQPVSGEFTKFNFSTGTTTTSETEWDIAFRGTTIIVNGGESQGTADEPERTGNAAAYITTGTFAEITTVDTEAFVQDSEASLAIPSGSGNGWYTYAGPPTHEIAPTPGKVLVFRTHNNTYAKVEILSYYENGAPNAEYTNYQYYTFNYVLQPNQGVTAFN